MSSSNWANGIGNTDTAPGTPGAHIGVAIPQPNTTVPDQTFTAGGVVNNVMVFGNNLRQTLPADQIARN